MAMEAMPNTKKRSEIKREWKEFVEGRNKQNESFIEEFERVSDVIYQKSFLDFSRHLEKNAKQGKHYIPVPKIIHYIWLGGPIYAEYWAGILDMADIALKNGYVVKIWVDNEKNLQFVKKKIEYDKKTEFEKKREIIPNDQYDLYINKLRLVEIQNINSLRYFPPANKFIAQIPQHYYRKLWQFIDSEMTGLKNFAAASDLLRYIILTVDGGIYLDTDIRSRALFTSNRKDILGKLKLHFGFQSLKDNNPILISSISHPIMVHSVLHSLKRYLILENFIREGETSSMLSRKRLFTEKGIKERPRRDWTIQESGPGVVKHSMSKFTSSLKDHTDIVISGYPRKNKPVINELYLFDQQIDISWVKADLHAARETLKLDNTVLSPLRFRDLFWFFGVIEQDDPNFRKKSDEEKLNIAESIIQHMTNIKGTVRMVKIGKNLYLEYKCDNTWLGSKNPPPFTID